MVGCTCFAIHKSMNIDEHASLKMLFIQCRLVMVYVLSNLPSNENLNLYYNCRNFIMIEKGIKNEMEHNAMLHIQWNVQQQNPTDNLIS